MTEENIEMVSEILEDYVSDEQPIDTQFKNKQICAVNFLYDKLKESEKDQDFFFHSEHDILLIGSDFDIFDDFTEEEAVKARSYGIVVSECGETFQISSSM